MSASNFMHGWAVLVGSLAMIALILTAFGIMLGMVKPADAVNVKAAPTNPPGSCFNAFILHKILGPDPSPRRVVIGRPANESPNAYRPARILRSLAGNLMALLLTQSRQGNSSDSITGQ